ncbi:MAG: alpha/beta fold hydrolase [Thermoplasmata archaeon]
MRSVRGGELSYELSGTSGDPVVLVHGSLSDRHVWDEVVPVLAQSMEVVSYDRRGHGGSPAARRGHPVRDDAADLAGLLEELNVYPVHVIAHSYGGAVALRLAADRPEMVRSLSVHEPPFLGLLADDPASASEAAELLDEVRDLKGLVRAGKTAVVAERLFERFSTEPRAWSRLSSGYQRSITNTVDRWAEEFDDPEAVVPDRAACRELMVPTLLTEGSESPRFLHRVTAALAELLHNSRVVEIPGVGHSPQVARPHQYVGLLLTFLLERNVPVS